VGLPIGLPRPDAIAALLCVVGGALGIAQLLLPWTSVVPGAGIPGANDTGLTGWEVFRTARAGAGVSMTVALGAYSVVGVALAGAALLLLGLATLIPLDHRPFGVAGLLLSLGVIGSAGWWLFRSRQLIDAGLSQVFAQAGVGWYLFLLCGPIAVIGSVKALATG
jgi:hypothetical protein